MTFCAGMFDHMIDKATASKGHLKRWCRAEDCTPTTASKFLHASWWPDARLSRVIPVAASLRSRFEGRRYIMCPFFTGTTAIFYLSSEPWLDTCAYFSPVQLRTRRLNHCPIYCLGKAKNPLARSGSLFRHFVGACGAPQ